MLQNNWAKANTIFTFMILHLKMEAIEILIVKKYFMNKSNANF